MCFEDRSLFPESLETGRAFKGLPAGAVTPDMPAEALYIVTEIYPSHVVLDGNHPLAGISLRLAIKVHAVREATPEELQQGSAGAGFFRVTPSAPGGQQLH